jgi:prepilin-type N-terminal cleavage/methylation domain-containing protein
MGFSLIELLVVAGIMGLSAALMAPVLLGQNNAAHLGSTLESMAEIKKEVLGSRFRQLPGFRIVDDHPGRRYR